MKARIALLLLLVSFARCFAVDPIATLAELRTALRDELKSALDKGNAENNERLYRLESLLVESLPDKELPDEKIAQTLHALTQIRSISRDKKVGELSEALVNELRTQSREAAKRLQESLDKTLAKSLRKGLNATKPDELDMPLKEIVELKKKMQSFQFRSSNSEVMIHSEMVQPVEEFLTAFQDVLFAAEKEDDATDAMKRLQNSTSNRQFSDLIPRSEFLNALNSALEKLPKSALKNRALTQQEYDDKISAMVGTVKRPEDIAGVLKEIQPIITQQRDAHGYFAESWSVTELKKLQRIYVDIMSGATDAADVNINAAINMGFAWTGKDPTQNFKNFLYRLVTQRTLGTDPAKAMKDDETLGAFFHRTVAYAMEGRDWVLLSKAIGLAQKLPASYAPLSSEDTSALRQFLAALNQERARQYSTAVATYLAVLKTGSQSIPLDFIGEHLTTIEKEHAKDYQVGVELSNNPPPDRYSPNRGFYPPGYPANRLKPATPNESIVPPPASPASANGQSKAEPNALSTKPTEPQSPEKKPESDKK
jgi:hypothetical protein